MIAEASLTGFLRTVLIILLVIFGLRILFRILLPLVLRYFLRRVEKKFYNQYQQNQYNQQTERQDIFSERTTSKNPTSKRNVGEYIDFEEIN